MRSNILYALAPEEERTVTGAADSTIAMSAHLMQIATQIRALGLAGKRAILFAPIGSTPGADRLVHEIADSLSVLDRASVLLVNLKTVPTHAQTMASPSSLAMASSPLASAKAEFSPAERNELHKSEPADFTHSLDLGERRVSHVDAAAGHAVDLPTLIESARPRVRYVLIDAPDVMVSASTLITAAYVDAVVLLVQRGHTLQSQIAATQKQFGILSVPIAGFIFVD